MQKDSHGNSYHVNMLVSLLVRFPEIFTIRYHVNSELYSLSYMVGEEISKKDYVLITDQIKENLDAYCFFQKKEKLELKIKKNTFSGFSKIEVNFRGYSTATEEISLINELFKEVFHDKLISEIRSEDTSSSEDIAASWEDMFDFLLSNNKNEKMDNLFAFRDSGKVYIFDK